MHHFDAVRFFAVALVPLLTLALVATAAGQGGDTLVSGSSPSSPFSQNKQNEPALAVDANHPSVLAAGANDQIDLEACNAGDDTTFPFTNGVGISRGYFSFNSGVSWVQPTYTRWTPRQIPGGV